MLQIAKHNAMVQKKTVQHVSTITEKSSMSTMHNPSIAETAENHSLSRKLLMFRIYGKTRHI